MAATLGSVLLVDDEPYVLESLTLSLRRHSYLVVTASSANEALATLTLEHVDVVVSDHQMPGTTGVELLSIIAQRFPSVARMLLTGNMTLPVALDAVNRGQVHRLLLKPCPPEELVASVRSGLAQAQLASATARLLAVAQQHLGHPNAEPSSPSPDLRPVVDASTADVGVHIATSFSKREREVLALLLRGRRTEEIASSLFVSRHTVRNHLKAMFRKAGVHSQRELMDSVKRQR